jgi:hypothetical protein
MNCPMLQTLAGRHFADGAIPGFAGMIRSAPWRELQLGQGVLGKDESICFERKMR